MTDDRDRHFASDEEILSSYVLGRLDLAERERIDRHAAACPTCRESLRREMQIAAGARRLGREVLKSELRRRIAAETRPARWPRVLSAAALIAIVAGLGVYYAWFSGAGRITPPVSATPPLAEGKESLRRDEVNAPVQGLAGSVKTERAAESPAPAEEDHGAAQKHSPPPVRRNADEVRRTEPLPRGGIAASEAARGAVTGEQAGEFWSEGIVEQAGGAPALNATAAQQKQDLLLKSKGMKEEDLKDARPRNQGEYLIRQQPSSALPGDRERAGGKQRTVPTRVDQTGSTTTMTMYLDSLLGEGDLKKARVEALSDDSLVVTLGGKKILYRFPPGQGAQQQRQK